MLTYAQLKDHPRRFLAVTSIRLDEFEALLPAFAEAYAATHAATHTQAGQPRHRQTGGGRKAQLATLEDKLLFIVMYHKTYPTQTVHGLQFGLGQSQTSDWIQRLLPVLQTALQQLGYAPEREPHALPARLASATRPVALQLDGTERRRQRPKNPARQRAHYSGKKRPTRTRT